MSEPEIQPRLTLRVGITGHRPDKLAAFDPDELRRSLSRVLERVDVAVGRRARGRGSAGIADGTRPAVRLVSALAEGADRMAVEMAPAGWALDALLPMPRAEYERDFLAPGEATSASVDAFRAILARADTIVELPALGPDLSRPGARAKQYAALGHALIGSIDLLVAIWDGKAAAGPGGTAHVVAEATAEGVPFIRVAPEGLDVDLATRDSAQDGSGGLGPTLDDVRLDQLLDGILAVRAAALPA